MIAFTISQGALVPYSRSWKNSQELGVLVLLSGFFISLSKLLHCSYNKFLAFFRWWWGQPGGQRLFGCAREWNQNCQSTGLAIKAEQHNMNGYSLKMTYKQSQEQQLHFLPLQIRWLPHTSSFRHLVPFCSGLPWGRTTTRPAKESYGIGDRATRSAPLSRLWTILQ